MVFGFLNAKGANKPNAGLLDLERTFGLPNGDIFHGAMTLNQIFSARPMLGFAAYRMLAAYLAGLVAVHTVLVVGVALMTRTLWKVWSIAPRLAGAAICGVGFTVLVTQIIPAP